MIDGTSFGIIAGYLRDMRSPIRYILHLKDRSKLSQVARRIELESSSGTSPAQPFSPGLLALVHDGAIKVSSREPVAGIAPSAVIDVTRVRRSAYTEVIYMPPFLPRAHARALRGQSDRQPAARQGPASEGGHPGSRTDPPAIYPAAIWPQPLSECPRGCATRNGLWQSPQMPQVLEVTGWFSVAVERRLAPVD